MTMNESETTRLRALLKRAALPACEAVDNGVGEWSVTHAGPPPWTVAELWDSPAASTDAVEARARLFAAIPTALPGLLDAAERVEREHREAGESTRAAWRESERREQELRDRLIAAERERDDLAATLETRNAEHALAMTQVREMEAIIAGRTTPPTDAEIEAHAAAGGGRWLVLTENDFTYDMPDAVSRDEWVRVGVVRWCPCTDDGRPCAWPAADVSRG
jgi:hypothetical protein